MVFEMRNIIILFYVYLIIYIITTYPRCENNNFTKKKLSINKSSLSGKFKLIDPSKSRLTFKNSVDDWASRS